MAFKIVPATQEDDADAFSFDELINDGPERLDYSKDEIPVEFVTGPAGTGKTFLQQQVIRNNPSHGILCATTGVAAINLGSITLNSILRFFDTESLEDAYVRGRLQSIMALLSRDARNLIIDEVSMLDADQLDLIYSSAVEVAKYRTVLRPLGLILTGDFCQLPPVNAKWAFQAKCWPAFERHLTRLTTNHRQADPTFISALNEARAGRGGAAAELLQDAGAHFANRLDIDFQGTTIVAKNTEVERFNRVALGRVTGEDIPISATRWGKQRGEWIWKAAKQTGIPDHSTVRINSLVMILANNPPEFTYVNGDLGYVRGYENGEFIIELLRNKSTVRVGKIERTLTQRNPPDHEVVIPRGVAEAMSLYQKNKPLGLPYYDHERHNWVIGSVTYFPLRAGYAVTVHKSQGLTLDRVQIDCREFFFGSPNMAYVALSRVRTPEGLHIVSPPEILARRIQVAPEVERWI